MLLNFNSQQVAPNLISAASPKSFDANAALGLTPSKYSGLQAVGNTGYYYGNNRMYEPYGTTKSSNNPLNYKRSIAGGKGAPAADLTVDGQKFRFIDKDITGFNKIETDKKNIYEYSPSQAYLSALRPAYMPTSQIGQNPILSLTSPLLAINNNSYGAGRYLGGTGDGILNIAAPQTTGK